MPDIERYTPAQLADETQTLAENYVGAVQEIEDTREGIAQVQETVDEINAKLPTPTYQTKTANPSNAQQTVTADNGYAALSAVVINPIAALMPANLEDYILRKDTMPEFSLSLSGEVPAYACYDQKKLVAVYGTPTIIRSYAFYSCSALQNVDWRSATSIYDHAFYSCSALQNVDCRSATSIYGYAFYSCPALQNVDCRSTTSIGIEAFRSCSALQNVDCRSATNVSNSSFHSCTQLNIIDFTSLDSSPTLGTNVFSNTNNAWKAVVKDDTVKALFQAATNWSTYANHIYTVAEIEALYGDTYDNLYLQWFGHARNEVTT